MSKQRLPSNFPARRNPFAFDGLSRIRKIPRGLVIDPYCDGHGKFIIVRDFFEPGKHMLSCCAHCKGTGAVTPLAAEFILDPTNQPFGANA